MTSHASNSLHSSLFKHHLMYNSFLNSNKLSKQKLCKRNYRFIHSFTITQDKRCPKVLSILKLISSLHLCTGAHRPKYLPLLKKLFKFHHKYLKKIGGDLEDAHLQRLLPLLSQLEISKNPSHWRLLTSRSAFKKLTFNFGPIGFYYRNPPERTIQNFVKYKAAFQRNLPKMKNLNSVKIIVLRGNLELALSLLEIINQKAHVESLKHLSLSTKFGQSRDSPPTPVMKPLKIDRALQSLTKLSVGDVETFSFLPPLAKFNNLTDLSLNFSPTEGSVEFPQHALFKDLPKVKKFAVSFRAHSFVSEAQFYENFTMPSTVENLALTLENFSWNEVPVAYDNSSTIQDRFRNDPIYTIFFEKLQISCQNVKILNLSILHTFRKQNHLPLIGIFACFLIQRFTKLEQISFQAPRSFCLSSGTEKQVKPWNLAYFWKGLKSFKETLVSVSINAEKIAFPEDSDVLDVRFPRLESLTLTGEVLCPAELGTFCCSIPSLKHIIIKDVVFSDEKEELRKFFLSWKNIPREMNVDLWLNVKRIKQQEVLVDCLTEYIQEVKIKGMLKMNFLWVQVRDFKGFQGVFDLVRKKGCFEDFSLILNDLSKVFQVQRYFVIEKDQELDLP